MRRQKGSDPKLLRVGLSNLVEDGAEPRWSIGSLLHADNIIVPLGHVFEIGKESEDVLDRSVDLNLILDFHNAGKTIGKAEFAEFTSCYKEARQSGQG